MQEGPTDYTSVEAENSNTKDRQLSLIMYIQNYWVFGLFPASGILGTIKHDVSVTGSVSVLRSVRETPTSEM
jgi:hypothetical protein